MQITVAVGKEMVQEILASHPAVWLQTISCLSFFISGQVHSEADLETDFPLGATVCFIDTGDQGLNLFGGPGEVAVRQSLEVDRGERLSRMPELGTGMNRGASLS